VDETPILISPELPSAHRDLVVWETTRERPSLRIEQTRLYVRAVDRAEARLELRREDRVVLDGDRIWVGDGDGVTLRVPAPERLDGVRSQQSYDGEVGAEGQTITSTRPVRPGITEFVATMVVGYDKDTDGYRLRLTAPLPTATMEVWVPERVARNIDASEAQSSVDERDGERWHVLRRTAGAREGESLVVNLEGLSGRQPDNPLVLTPEAAVGSGLAFFMLVTTVVLLQRLRPVAARVAEPLP
jgi:hypothetical protein